MTKLAAIGIDCEIPVSWDAPGAVDGLLSMAERNAIPMTWLISSRTTRPTETAEYYSAHVLHRIPDTHEIGLHVHFDDHKLENYVSDPAQRRRHIERGLEVLRDRNIKPTSFRAGCLCLQPCDVKVLEEGGIVVDSTPCPGGKTNHLEHVDWKDHTLRGPYRPSYHSLFERGDARLIVLPICSSQERDASGHCAWGFAEYRGWPELKRQLEWYVDNARFVTLGTHDGPEKPKAHAQAEVLDEAVRYLKSHGFEFATLTRMGLAWAAEEGERT